MRCTLIVVSNAINKRAIKTKHCCLNSAQLGKNVRLMCHVIDH